MLQFRPILSGKRTFKKAKEVLSSFFFGIFKLPHNERLKLKPMNKFILIFFALGINYEVYSQNVSNPELDLHRNVSEINLGDSYEKWKKFLFNKEVHNERAFSYTFQSDSCCNTVFDNPTSLVWITFQDNKVASIRIELRNFLEGKKMTTAADVKLAVQSAVMKYVTINKRFSTLFGDPYASHSNEQGIRDEPTSIVQWMGTNTFLESNYYYYKAIYPATRTVGTATGLTEKLEEARDKTVVILSDLKFLKEQTQVRILTR